MPNFTEPVSIFMSTPVHSISEDASLQEAGDAMREHDVSSLAVLGESNALTGVISHTDILGSGLRNAGNRPDAALLESTGKVRNVMTSEVLSVDIESSMTDAAARMVEARVHRVFVTAGGNVAGVLSTWDIMASVEAVRVAKPASEFMSTPVFTVRATETIALASERLGKAHVTGLLVVDESQWPVGVFSQREALEAADAPRSATIESAMNAAVLTLPDRSALHNVARQARAMNARRVAVMNRHELVGIMTGVDFAKAIC
ncbi:MAG: CBS domain-containing protein [Myxococcales bacterium]|nr:CBS domain-containing protein [Myxococcales bacterium]